MKENGGSRFPDQFNSPSEVSLSPQMKNERAGDAEDVAPATS
jgi:hypothetical protein